MSNKKVLALICISITVVIWGLSFISIKISVQVVPPMTLALLRFLLASLLLFTWLRVKEPGARMKRKDIPRTLLGGAVGITAYFFFENNGVKLITASEASIIIGIIPVVGLLAESLFFRKKLSFIQIVSVILSFGGVLLVAGAKVFPAAGAGVNTAGYLFMVGAVLAWVVYNFLTRPLHREYTNLAISCYQTLWGTLLLVPLSLFEFRLWQPIPVNVVFHIVYLGLLSSALGYFFYIFSLKVLGVTINMLFINVIPVVTVVAGLIILGETLSPLQMAGGGMILSAVVLSVNRPSRVCT